MRITEIKVFPLVLVVVMSFHFVACDSLLDVELDKAKITKDRVFSDDVVATSAMNGVYSGMFDRSNFASGSNSSITAWGGLLADELETYSKDPDVNQFAQNEIRPENAAVLALWSSMYRTVYQANAVIEGVNKSSTLTVATKERLEGEARFVRAFCHFYLTNFFGDVPLNVTTDYRKNAVAAKRPGSDIYAQIVEDLDIAENKLASDYIMDDRGRPNRAAATALKSRVALFMGRWADAEASASSVIGDGRYALVDLDQVFKINNQEAIWQLQPVESYVTQEAYFYILSASPAVGYNNNALRDDFVDSFAPGDSRRDHWISSYSDGAGIWYFPFKYKIQASTGTPEEASTVLRLAEQYLIRAEARLREGNKEGAMADIDSIRSRSGLPLVSESDVDISADSLFSLLEHERHAELFVEWGHRWLDLKRRAELNSTLENIKPNWNSGDELLPLPQVERNRNPYLGDQNPGYF